MNLIKNSLYIIKKNKILMMIIVIRLSITNVGLILTKLG